MKEISAILDRLATTKVRDGDYTEDGYLMCGSCRERKQYLCDFPTRNGVIKRLVPIPCLCERKEMEQAQQQKKQYEIMQQVERLRKDGITDPTYLKHTFLNDDGKSAKVSEVCKRYVSKWEKVKRENIGMLFYGPVGTGKSFFACAIANALLEQCVPVCVTSLPRLLEQRQMGERTGLLERLNRCHLLVIDDLGAERCSSYAAEQVYNLIDGRARAGMPTIVTTNLTLEDLEKPESLAYQRIYDRILEMCPVRVKVVGESRRTEKALAQKAKAREILGV